MEMAVVPALKTARPLCVPVSVTVTGCLLELEVEGGSVQSVVALAVEQVVQVATMLHPAGQPFSRSLFGDRCQALGGDAWRAGAG
jgi:hypothetical protein